jgi:acid phosphatase
MFALVIRMKTPLTLVIAALVLSVASGCGGSGTSSNTAASSPSSTLAQGSSNSAASAGSSAIPRSSHVFLVIEENQSFTTIYDNNTMPFLNSLAKFYAYSTNYTSNAGGSMLDYLWLSSGSTESAFGCEGWGCPNQMTKPITDDNIFREITKAGLTWKVYAESLPSAGYLADGPVPYANRHNPAVWYSDVVNSPEMQKNVVPFSQFATDVANGTLPNYSVIIPNLDNDAHDGTPQQADSFLWGQVQPVFNLPMFKAEGDALMFITFDECGGGTNEGCAGHIMTTLVGPKVRKGFVSQQPYSHSNALRTIMDALGVRVYPGASAQAAPMADFF